MFRNDFSFLTQEKILVVQGTIVSELERRLKTANFFLPKMILSGDPLVASVIGEFAAAGADILTTPTSQANRTLLEKFRMEDHIGEVHRRAVGLCREVAGEKQMIFGAIGPTGALLRPYGRLDESDYRKVYHEQGELLLDLGVDGFILEGFSSLIEAENCVKVLRKISNMPIIACMSFLEDGRTKFGDTTEDCFSALVAKGADVVGMHGVLGPLEIDGFLGRVQGEYNLCARPNAGYPVRIGNTKTYLSSPEYVAECAELLTEKGVVVVGGAEGFTPHHIRKVVDQLHGKKPVRKEAAGSETDSQVSFTAEPGKTQSAELPSLAKKLGREPVLTVELEPPRGLEVEPILGLLNQMRPLGVDAVNIPENPLARARISSIALAKLIRDKTGLDAITHLTCRDRNLISLQAELLGAHVLGVDTILALTGDPSGVGDYPTATSIFDVDSSGLVEIMARMNLGKDFGMNDLGKKTQFKIGVASNPLATDLNAELKRVEEKLSLGAHFIQTQPIFKPKAVEPYLKALESFRVPVIFGVMLVRDYRHAKFLANEYPGIHLDERDLERFRVAEGEDQGELGVTLAAELVRELKPLSGGVYLMPGFGEEARLLDVLQALQS